MEQVIQTHEPPHCRGRLRKRCARFHRESRDGRHDLVRRESGASIAVGGTVTSANNTLTVSLASSDTAAFTAGVAQSIPLIGGSITQNASLTIDTVVNATDDPDEGPKTDQFNLNVTFIEQQLGAGSGSLQSSSGISTLEQVFPNQVSGSNFNSGNSTMVDIKAFEINSTTQEFLFKISVDVEGTNPSQGFIALPAALSSWLIINNLAISFSATTRST